MSGPDAGDGADERDGNEGQDRRETPATEPEEPHHGSGPGTATADDRPRDGGPEPARSTDDDAATIEDDGPIRWFLATENESVALVRDVVSSVAVVALIGLLLFGVSGIWPPLVAVESGSMHPNMQEGDLIFVVDDDRFVGDGAVDDTGVVTLEDGRNSGHEKFGRAGDVIIFQPDGDDRRTPVIHRAHFWVEEDENWVDTRANAEFVGEANCRDLESCPAPHDGFVTMGDANGGYDQHPTRGARTTVVSPDWVTGKAMFRIPWLGNVRLAFDAIFGSATVPEPGLVDPVAAATGGEPTSSALPSSAGGAVAVAATGVAGGIARNRLRRRY